MPFKVMRLKKKPVTAVLVQSSGARSGNGGTEAWTWATAPTVGNRIIIQSVGWRSGTAPSTITCADTASNSYTDRATAAIGDTRTTHLDAPVTSSPSSSTVTFTGGAADHSVVFEEWSGLTPTTPYDTNATVATNPPTSTATTLTVGPTATLAQNDEIIFTTFGAATGLSNSLISAPSGYTGIAFEQNSPAYIGMGAAYKIVAANTAVSAVWPFSTGVGGVTSTAVIATYKIG